MADLEFESLIKRIKELENEKEEQVIQKLKKALNNTPRIDITIKAYETHLKRKPSIHELKHHIFSKIPDKDIDKMISLSAEAKNIQNRIANNGVSYNFINEKIAIGETPSIDNIQKLKEKFNIFISLNEEPPSYLAICQQNFKSHFSLKSIPLNPNEIIDACLTISKAVKENKTIYLQCEIGGPKSLIVLMFYMVAKEGKTFKESIKLITEKRSLCQLDMNLLSLDNIITIYNGLK